MSVVPPYSEAEAKRMMWRWLTGGGLVDPAANAPDVEETPPFAHGHQETDVAGLTADLALKADDSAVVHLVDKGAASGVASLDGTGKVPSAQLPPATTQIFTDASQAAMLAESTAVVGATSVRTDLGPPAAEFRLVALPASTLGNWIQTGSSAVTSVQGLTGAVVLPEDPSDDTIAALHRIGTGLHESCGGADARLSDARTPTAHDHVVVQTIAVGGTTQTIDLAGATSTVVELTLTANCSLTFTGFPSSDYGEVLMRCHQNGTGGWTASITNTLTWSRGGLSPVFDTTATTGLTEFVVASSDGTTLYGLHNQPVREYDLWVSGSLTVAAGAHRRYMRSAGRIVGVQASLGAGTATFDLNRNGTTVYTTQANRPAISSGNFVTATLPDVTALAAGQYLSGDVDVTSSGANSVLTVAVLHVS